MHSTYVHEIAERRSRRLQPEQIVSLIGPLTVAGGVVWAILQPWRVTLLHPFGQGFWWLLIEPPLLVVAVGIVFAFVVARPLLADLESRRATAG